MNILFTICGRAGSKGFKNKNLKLLNGVPLVYYTMSAIKLFLEKRKDISADIALNTDSNELIEQINTQEILPNITIAPRKAFLAGDKAAKVDVIRDTYEYCKKNKTYDMVIDLDITSPLRREIDIENAICEYLKDEECDLIVSVVPARRSPYFNMVEKKGSYYQKICESDYTTRQEAPHLFELNASIYVYRPRFLESKPNKSILEYKCGISVMPDYLVLDIDSEEDFEMMQAIMDIYIKKDKGLAEVAEKAALSYEKRKVFRY